MYGHSEKFEIVLVIELCVEFKVPSDSEEDAIGRANELWDESVPYFDYKDITLEREIILSTQVTISLNDDSFSVLRNLNIKVKISVDAINEEMAAEQAYEKWRNLISFEDNRQVTLVSEEEIEDYSVWAA